MRIPSRCRVVERADVQPGRAVHLRPNTNRFATDARPHRCRKRTILRCRFLVDRLRFDPEPGVLTQKLVTRRNRAGAAGHQDFTATSDRRISEGGSVIADPTDIVSVVNGVVDSAEALFLYRQKKIPGILSSAQSRRSHGCRI